MKVRELVAALQAQDPEMLVVMPSEVVDFCEVAAAFVDKVWLGDGQIQLSDERDRDIVRVVRLFGADVEEEQSPSR